MSFFFYIKIYLRADFTIDTNVQVYSFTASAYFKGTKNVKKKYFYDSLNTYIIYCHSPIQKNTRPAFGLRNVSENLGVQILNSLNSAKNTPMQALYTLFNIRFNDVFQYST